MKTRFELERFEDGKWIPVERSDSWTVVYLEFDRRKQHSKENKWKLRITEIRDVREIRAEYYP